MIKQIADSIPLNSNGFNHAGTALYSAAATSFYYGAPWVACFVASAGWIAKQCSEVKRVGEMRTQEKQKGEQIKAKLIHLVQQCVNYQANGYSVETQANMKTVLDEVKAKHCAVKQGGQLRAQTVGLQQIFEHVIMVLVLLDDMKFEGAIHTAQPPTPLCTLPKQTHLPALVTPQLLMQPDALQTVKERTVSLRAILDVPGTKLYCVYSKGGLYQRTTEQQEVFNNELQNRPGSLYKHELPITIDPQMSGATYILVNSDAACAFCVDAQQANQQNAEKWGITCGSLVEPVVNQRVNQALSYILQQGGPDIRDQIKKDTGYIIRGQEG